MDLGFYSYVGAAIAYGFFALLLLFGWRRSSLQGRLLTGTIILSAIWAGLAAKVAQNAVIYIEVYQIFEILRYVAWYVFLLNLLSPAAKQGFGYRRFLRWSLPLSTGFAFLLLVFDYIAPSDLFSLHIIGHVFLAIFGIAIIEQLFRNTSVRHLWTIRPLFVGVAGIFAFDFYLYADALLFRDLDADLWQARGIINLLAVPLLVISAGRNKDWSLNIFVSRDIVLNTTTIIGSGLFLLAMAAAGYYLREYGGSWGRIIQVVLFSLAVALLVEVAFSGQLRARIKVFLGKHFYRNKYDYRREWLRLTTELSGRSQGEEYVVTVIRVLAHIVDARAGLLWLRDPQGHFCNVAVWNMDPVDGAEHDESTLARFLEEKGFVINLTELESCAGEYEGLDLPEWLTTLRRPWLVVPLFGLESLMGFVVLANPLIARSINWEDRDLLKTAAKQVASHLALLMTSDDLAKAKQFEVFNRLSAYMVHDLKNVAAELELVARNADKHKSNPAFLDDAFETVNNAAAGIKKLLDQLRNKHMQSEKKGITDLGKLLKDVIDSKRDQSPAPQLDTLINEYFVAVEKNRLTSVLAHLIDNAQQATEDDGEVRIKLSSRDSMHIIEIRDTGHGMDADFIRNRLFEPFDTTKGNAGMGIGMYESQEFMRYLGGEINVESKLGEGTVISLHIPVNQSARVQKSASSRSDNGRQ